MRPRAALRVTLGLHRAELYFELGSSRCQHTQFARERFVGGHGHLCIVLGGSAQRLQSGERLRLGGRCLAEGLGLGGRCLRALLLNRRAKHLCVLGGSCLGVALQLGHCLRMFERQDRL